MPLLVIAYFAISTVVTLYTVGDRALPVDDHVANYDRLWTAVDAVYPHFDAKPVDWGGPARTLSRAGGCRRD
ncbi:MAG: hypothetical protein IPK19_40595 [Chloroflexi bacterium]|nr:hypothetical protein [Chloroflexota bacterium]